MQKSRKTQNQISDFPMAMMPNLESWMEMNGRAAQAIGDLNHRIYENVASLNTEVAQFVNRRLEEDLSLPEHLMSCRSVPEMYNVYANFFQTAMQQYQEESQKLARMSADLASETSEAMQQEAAEAVKRNGGNR